MALNHKQFQEELKKPREPVAVCQIGNHPIYESEASSDEETHTKFCGAPICFAHLEEVFGREVDKHPIGVPRLRPGGRGRFVAT